MFSPIDMNWVDQPRNSKAYINGIADFVEFAKKGVQNGKIRCPCNICQVDRKKILTVDEVEKHILRKGFYKEYKDWIFHGPMTLAQNISNQRTRTSHRPSYDQARLVGGDDMARLLKDAIGIDLPSNTSESVFDPFEGLDTNDLTDDGVDLDPNIITPEEEAKYKKIIDASNEELY